MKYDVKESSLPFSSQVMAALGRDLQSNFASCGFGIGTHLIALRFNVAAAGLVCVNGRE